MKSFIYKNLYFFVWLYHWLLAFLGAFIFCFPSRKIYVVGVTGTKGKSTTIELIAAILEKAGEKVAVSSSIRNGESAMTMPGRFFLQRFLRRAVGDGCDYALIEVTSQGVAQNRHLFINWQAAIFTNLSPEHIEAHGNFERYREAKVKFFRYVAKKFNNRKIPHPNLLPFKRGEGSVEGLFLVNKDDANAHYFIEVAAGGEIILYGKSDLSSKLVGEFNKYNIGAAVAFARSQGISEDIIAKAVREFSGVSGRMEFVQKEPFAVVIDYAHTPDSLREVYRALRLTFQCESSQDRGSCEDKKLICVLGCAGGGRDKWKRPEMGKIAAEYCDEIILTNEDSYDEWSEKIIEEINDGIISGLRKTGASCEDKKIEVHKILDRQEAIKKAIDLAKEGDMVIITGKGSEKWIHLARGQKIPWSEKQVVIDILNKKN